MNPTSIIRVFGKSKLGRRFTVITLMFLGVLLGIMVYTTMTIQKQKSNGILIDMAGRQRMLFEKHLNEVYLTSQGITADYNSTRELLRSTLASLMKGGSVILNPETGKSQTIPAVPTEEILLKLHEQANHFDKVIESSDGLLMLSSDFPEFYRTLKTLRAQNSIVIGMADDAVKLLNRHSESNITEMVKWEAITAFFVTLLGVFATAQGIRASKKLENEIVERKRAESLLQNSELFLNSILENIPDMIFVKDAKDLRFLRFNKAGEELIGFPKEAMIGKTDYDFFPKSEADFYTTKDREVFADKTLIDIPEEVIQTKSQGTRYLHTKKIPILDDYGTPKYLLGISEDITEQKLAKLEHTQRELLLRLIFETGPGCIKRVAADGTLLHMNPAGLDLIEAEGATEALGLSVFDLVIPEHVGAFRAMHQKVLEGEPQTLQFEVQGLKGGRRWMETYAVPFSNPLTNEVEQLAVTHDITERKTTEEVIRKGERKFRAIYEQAPNGIAVLDSLNGRFTQINQKYCDITGYSQEEMLDRTFQNITHQDDLQADLAWMQQLLTDQISSFEMEKRYIRKDREVVWVHLTCVPLWLEPTDPRQHIAMVVDITQRKHAEEVLKKSRQEFQTLVDSLEGVVWVAEFPSYRFTFVSQQAERLLGYPIEQWLTEPNFFCNRLHESDQSWVVEYCREATLRKENHQMEYRFIHANGKEIWLKDLITVVVENDQPVKLRGVMFDISKIKKAEKAIRATEQMYGQILDSISDMVLMKDQNFRILWANKAFREYYNMTNEELKGIIDSPINEPDFTRQYNEADAHVFNTGKILDIPEEPVTRHDGHVGLFHTIKAPLFGENGEVVKSVGVSRDITERKNFENALEALAKGAASLGNQNFFRIWFVNWLTPFRSQWFF